MTGTDAQTTLTIGDLARRSGVPVGTIRAWEQRYGLLSPARSPGGHRRFGEEDLRRINAVRMLVGEGVTLAAAAERVLTAEGHQGTGARGRRRDRLSVPTPAPLPSAGLDPRALEAAYRATRALLHIRAPGQAVDVVVDLVAELGGRVEPAEQAGPDALPLDLSLGERPPLLPAADAYSVARLHLERVLPTVLEDARRAAAVARRLSSRSGGPTPRR